MYRAVQPVELFDRVGAVVEIGLIIMIGEILIGALMNHERGGRVRHEHAVLIAAVPNDKQIRQIVRWHRRLREKERKDKWDAQLISTRKRQSNSELWALEIN